MAGRVCLPSIDFRFPGAVHSMSDPTTPSSVSDMTVVVADDDPITRGLLSAVLRGIGMNVQEEARDGTRALALTQKLRPHVLCLDIEMPGLSGLDALLKLRETDRETIVLMITGATTAE